MEAEEAEEAATEAEVYETTLRATELLEEVLEGLEASDETVGAGAPSCPIAYGSVAFWLGRKRPTAGQEVRDTHRWTGTLTGRSRRRGWVVSEASERVIVVRSVRARRGRSRHKLLRAQSSVSAAPHVP